ncbi:MAG: FeoB-associated Cys-rich membrane protein [Opitutales bacterium]|nr:FeoB-associated Cys-rich membrane protein [Opitutales bacterium]
MILDYIVVGLIVLAAFAYVVRSLVRGTRGGNCRCGSCPAATLSRRRKK